MKNYFKAYVSNTLAGSGNQSYFVSDNTIQTGRVFYKVFAGGKYNYSFMFTNVIDSTYADGAHSKANLRCKEWTIKSLNAKRTIIFALKSVFAASKSHILRSLLSQASDLLTENG